MGGEVLDSTVVVGIYTDYDTLYNFCKNTIDNMNNEENKLFEYCDDYDTDDIIEGYISIDYNTFDNLIKKLLKTDLICIRSQHIDEFDYKDRTYCICILSGTDQGGELDLKKVIECVNDTIKMNDFYRYSKLITGKEVSKIKIIALSNWAV